METKFTFKQYRRNLLFFAICLLVGWGSSTQAQTYCTPTYSTGCSGGDDIRDVILNGAAGSMINNLNTPCPTGGYVNYTTSTLPNMTATLVIGASYNGNVTTNYTGSEQVKVWIDFNQNGTFEAAEVVATLNNITSTSTGAMTVAVPATALPGATRMRVRLTWSGTAAAIDPCNAQTWGECHDYKVTLQAPVPCTSVTFPASATASANPLSICAAGNVNLNINPVTPMPAASGTTYQWQSGPSATGPWTNIGTAGISPAYTAAVSSPTTTNIFFRCQVLCNGTVSSLTSSATPAVVISNPGLATGTPGSRCGPGSVALSATGAPGTTLRWYEAATGGAPLFIGANFNTPYITSTRNYYVSAGTPPAAGNATIGAGALVPSFNYVTIFAGGWGGYKHQFLITAAELVTAGILPGTAINSISVDNDNGTSTYNGFSMALKSTATTALTTTFEAGAVNVLPATNYTTVLGNNTFTFPTPYTYTGGSLLIETCWSNGTSSNPYSNIKYDNTSFAATHYGYQDLATPAVVCTNPLNAGSVVNQRPQFKINFDGSCQGTRSAVLATVNTSTSVPKAAPAVVCNDAVATVTLTPPAAPNNYSGYTWSPATNLYTNAAATTPYVAGANATTVYMKTTNVGQQTYYMMAGNPALTTGCTFADTVRIHVQPANVTIKGQPDTICVSGTTTLSLDTIAGYFAGSIQWQTSTTGNVNDYVDVAGATNTSYTTPTLTFGNNRYYRALIKAGTAVCQSPVKYVVVANPTIVSAPDSFHCGPGPVTLDVVTGGNGSAVWYENATGGLPIASGSPFVTPFLGATTSYWVSSGGGGTAGVQTVGAGALTGTGTYSPFVGGWGGVRSQYMIKAAELIAAGVPPGANLNSLAFDVTSGAGTQYPGFAISMKTTTANNLTPGFEGGLTQVKSPATHTTTLGINTFLFDTPFPWNGTDNIIVQTCWSNQTSTAVASGVRYDNITGANNAVTRYRQQDLQTPAAICGTTAGTTLTSRPQIRLGYDNRCESARQEVIAYIRPQPVVDLGPNINKCVDAGAVEVLNAGVQPNVPAYLWDNGSTSQVRAITASGNYNVSVTNQYGCVGYDTIQVTLRANPVVELGNDTSVCNGVSLTLNAGNDGIDYFWNTGAVTQTINVNTAGTYNVFVTNGVACTKTDTITIAMQGELPTIQGIAVNNNGQYTFTFSAINPQNVIGYEWDFGDGSLPSYQQSPTHTYPDAGNYIVVLKLSSSCGFKNDSTSAHIVGLNQLNVDNGELSVYPNPTKGQATILSKGALKMEKIEVYNILGQQVYSTDADSKDKHSLDLDRLASGVYTIQVFTDKGNVARKLEILK